MWSLKRLQAPVSYLKQKQLKMKINRINRAGLDIHTLSASLVSPFIFYFLLNNTLAMKTLHTTLFSHTTYVRMYVL